MSFIVIYEDICPSITADIVKELQKIKIISVKDFLSSDLTKIYRQIRNKDIDFKKLLKIKNELHLKFGPKKVNAFNQLRKELKTRIGYQTGVQKLDEMLENGIKRGELTEVFGYSDSGKTQFCYTFLINFIVKYKKCVLFLDTDLSFCKKRIVQIMKTRIPGLTEDKIKDFISMIKVIQVLDNSSFLDTIEIISNDLETNIESEFKDIGVVIVDTLSTVLNFEFKSNWFEADIQEKEKNNSSKASEFRYRTLDVTTQMGNTLHCFASKHSLPVIVVNLESVALKYNWKNYCKLCLNFVTNKDIVEKDRENEDFYPFKGITIDRSYNKNIENKTYDKFKVFESGINAID